MSFVIRLLGPFSVEIEGEALGPLRGRTGQWLLALLALRHGRSVERDWLCGTLWPDSPDLQARGNLRRTLTDLRRALGPEAERLQSPTSTTLSLDLQNAFCDLLWFDANAPSADPVVLRKAVDLYRGPLLEGCTEEWVAPERLAREQLYLRALETLAIRAEESEDYAAASGYLRRVIELEPLRESAHRALMQTLAAGGDHAAAVLVYRELRLRLHRDLNAAPDPETAALFQQIRSSALARSPAPAPSAPAPAWQEAELPAEPHLAQPRLPRPLTRLVGREREVAELRRLLRCERLVTLTGPGGVGKTRLAIQAAEECRDEFPDGVYFVDLAPLTDPDLILRALADLLGAKESEERALLETLLRLLMHRSLLLILDNCEHLSEACALLAGRLLDACPDLRIVATSRQPLGLTGEIVRQTPPLSLPDPNECIAKDKDAFAHLLDYDAVRLFILRAKAVNPDFQVTPNTILDLIRICRLVDGIPLAIELAAARARALSLAQIAERLHSRLQLLTIGSRAAPQRHQTLRATLDWSYDLLSDPERTLLQRLSLFAGGWTLDAAEQICAVEVLDLLTSLIDKSLVVYEERDGEARYRLLETMREYARERLPDEDRDRLTARYADYFLRMLTAARQDADRWNNIEAWRHRLHAEQDNLRQALDWWRETDADAALEYALLLRGFGYCTLQERKDWIDWLKTASPPYTPIYAALYRLVGSWAHYQGDHIGSYQFMEKSVEIANACGDVHGAAHSLLWLAGVDESRGEMEQARARYQEVLAYFEAAGEHYPSYSIRNRLARWTYLQGDAAGAAAMLEQSLEAGRRSGDVRLQSNTLSTLADIAYQKGDLTAARAYWEEGLRLVRKASPFDAPTKLRMLAAVARDQDDNAAAWRYLEEALDLCRKLNSWGGEAWTLFGMASIADRQGRQSQADHCLRQSLRIFDENGEMGSAATCLRRFARFAIARGQMEQGVRLWTQAMRLIQEHRWESPSHTASDYEQDMTVARAALSADRFAAAEAAGRMLTLETAVHTALNR